MIHSKWLDKTIEMAIDNVRNGGGPFAAIVVKDGEIIGTGTNLVHVNNDPSAHAELLAIREACATLSSIDLSDCVLYASGEPCPMCLGAAYWSTVGNIYYACSKTDALEGANFDNPLASFIPIKLKNPKTGNSFHSNENRNSLAPFQEWNRKNDNAEDTLYV